jgi:release factor glutamine methyltransferase
VLRPRPLILLPCFSLMVLKEALSSAVAQLEQAQVGSPRMNAEVLLMFVLACDRAYLYAHPERALTTDEQERYEKALAARCLGVPAQYITGHQEFWGLDFLVNPSVLIPRPETEHVIETVLELERERSAEIGPQGGKVAPPLKLVDVGTGSGCIALALANEFPHAEIVAVDISAPALETARINAARLGLERRVRFLPSDLLADLAAGAEFDYVVSNPPYVGEDAPAKVQREVREFEPRVAVFAGPTGMEAYRRLIPQAREVLQPRGWLVMEIGYSIEPAVRVLLEGWRDVRVTADLQGIPRVVAARR